jgi:hypothetical protein
MESKNDNVFDYPYKVHVLSPHRLAYADLNKQKMPIVCMFKKSQQAHRFVAKDEVYKYFLKGFLIFLCPYFFLISKKKLARSDNSHASMRGYLKTNV